MKKFEIGKVYFDTSACDHECVFKVEIVGRSDKMVTFRRDNRVRRAKIYTDDNGEYITPDRYSMAPVFRASREWSNEPEAATAAAPEVVAVAMVGQAVVANWGACYPQGHGVILGFASQEAGRFSKAATLALVRLEDGHTSEVELEQIHPQGWRSAGGSPIGVFYA